MSEAGSFSFLHNAWSFKQSAVVLRILERKEKDVAIKY